MENEVFPVLYILMRNDLPSMNCGKGMAQSSHASNMYVHTAHEVKDRLNDSDFAQSMNSDFVQEQVNLVWKWEAQTSQGFGTVMVLSVTEAQMRSAVQVAQAVGLIADTVNDPSYPYIVDSETARLIPESKDTVARMPKGDKTVMFRSEDTCAFVGGDKNNPLLQAIVGNFPLHP